MGEFRIGKQYITDITNKYFHVRLCLSNSLKLMWCERGAGQRGSSEGPIRGARQKGPSEGQWHCSLLLKSDKSVASIGQIGLVLEYTTWLSNRGNVCETTSTAVSLRHA